MYVNITTDFLHTWTGRNSWLRPIIPTTYWLSDHAVFFPFFKNSTVLFQMALWNVLSNFWMKLNQIISWWLWVNCVVYCEFHLGYSLQVCLVTISGQVGTRLSSYAVGSGRAPISHLVTSAGRPMSPEVSAMTADVASYSGLMRIWTSMTWIVLQASRSASSVKQSQLLNDNRPTFRLQFALMCIKVYFENKSVSVDIPRTALSFSLSLSHIFITDK